MRNLAEDRDEFDPPATKLRAWVTTARRNAGIRPDEGSCWFVTTEQQNLETKDWDTDLAWLGSSPGDALSYADAMAAGARYQQGTGRWILETFEDGVNGPRYLVVAPHLDEVVS